MPLFVLGHVEAAALAELDDRRADPAGEQDPAGL